MSKKIALFTCLILCSLTAFSQKFDTIVTFGDSMSDNGNLYKILGHFIPKSPPYYEGHFSNGPVWVEYLDKSFFDNGKSGNLLDFAVGGACAIFSYEAKLPYTLKAEVYDYLYFHRYKNKHNSLFIIWIGGNNYLSGPTNVEAITTAVVDTIGEDIKELIDKDATMFLVVNLPDIGKTPEAKAKNNQSLLTELASKHNQKLLEKFNTLKAAYPKVTFAYFDVSTIFNQLMERPQQFDITHTEEPCYAKGGLFLKAAGNNNQIQLQNYLTQQAEQQNITLDNQTQQAILTNPALREALEVGYKSASQPALTATLSCDDYLFWDHIHPTTAIHKLLAQYATSALEAAGLQPSDQ